MSDERPSQVPLIEQLRSVPKGAREFVQTGEYAHRNIPYGRMCHDAADALDAANERIRELEAAHIENERQLREWQDRCAETQTTPTSEEVERVANDLVNDAAEPIQTECVWQTAAALLRRLDRERQALRHRLAILQDPDDEPSAGDYECTR